MKPVKLNHIPVGGSSKAGGYFNLMAPQESTLEPDGSSGGGSYNPGGSTPKGGSNPTAAEYMAQYEGAYGNPESMDCQTATATYNTMCDHMAASRFSNPEAYAGASAYRDRCEARMQTACAQVKPSAPSAGVSTGTCPNPGKAAIESYSDTTDSTTHEQVFKIGDSVNPGFVYSCGVYSVVCSVTAAAGDTPSTIASKLAAEVNNTSQASWNASGSNNKNFKPSAGASGALITLMTDNQHAWFASASGECTATAPAPDPSPAPTPTPIPTPVPTPTTEEPKKDDPKPATPVTAIPIIGPVATFFGMGGGGGGSTSDAPAAATKDKNKWLWWVLVAAAGCYVYAKRKDV